MGNSALRKTRDGRHVVAINIYPRLHTRALNFLRASDNPESVNNAILQWRAEELESAAQEAGIVFAKVRTNEEFLREPQHTEVLSSVVGEPIAARTRRHSTMSRSGPEDRCHYDRSERHTVDGSAAAPGSV